MCIEAKKNFIINEFFTMSWGAAVQHNKTYKTGVTNKQKTEFKNGMIAFIKTDILPKYYDERVAEECHVKSIEQIKQYAEKEYKNILNNCIFKYGTAQKLLNLVLKYLWCLSEIPEPPHCPIDRNVLESCRIRNINWTEINSEDEYNDCVSKIKAYIGNQSLAQWELEQWNTGNTL